MQSTKIDLHKERRSRERMVSSILEVDPLAEFCLGPIGNAGPPLHMEAIPRRIVFEKGTGATITSALEEMKIRPKRLFVWEGKAGYVCEIQRMDNIYLWLAGVIDYWTEKIDPKNPWVPFQSFSFEDQDGQKVSITPPDDHDIYWQPGGRYAGKFTYDCFEIHVQEIG